MRSTVLCLMSIFSFTVLLAQKKPLDHSVYDSWQSIGDRQVSNDGKWVVYNINVQEGDNNLVIRSVNDTYSRTIPRGYNAQITEDNRFVICSIKPFYKAIRDARIKKKKPDEFPKDSLAIIDLQADTVIKIANVKSFKIPEKAAGWLAYHLEKKPADKPKNDAASKKSVDSLQHIIDSLQIVLQNKKYQSTKDGGLADADEEGATGTANTEGSDLVLRRLGDGFQKTYPLVAEYLFNKTGRKLLLETTKDSKDSLQKAAVLVVDLLSRTTDTISKGGNDFKNFSFTEDGNMLAYLAERDSKPKDLQKFYKLWIYREGMDTAIVLVDKNAVGMQIGMTISENAMPVFSKTGERLFFGTAPIMPPRDTSLVDIDLVKIDIWNYKDDYLQPQQLYELSGEMKRSYLAEYDFTQRKMMQLASKELPVVITSNEGDGKYFVGMSDVGKRIATQWEGGARQDIYAINAATGEKKLVRQNLDGRASVSAAGNYIIWYDNKAKNYFVYDGEAVKNITSQVKVPLYDEDNDVPDDPSPYGTMRWSKNDEAVFIYDKYDIWKVDPTGKKNPVNITAGDGRKTKTTFRYINLDKEDRFIPDNQELVLSAMNELTKHSGYVKAKADKAQKPEWLMEGAYATRSLNKAEDNNVFIYTKETYQQSPDIYVNKGWNAETKLSAINPQQQQYNWGTSELVHWKAFNGKPATGVLFKPENFDSTKKYPIIFYFYEKLSDNLYQYAPPTPTGSRLNIPFFVSRGYLVMTPDISYTTGHPAKDAYNYIVSGAKYMAQKKWVDGKNMGIQGQSWGGIQVAQLVTMTDMFKAAWAGAPVANMTSAYGGIRWESGRNRQFQYEKTQSRIGATLWERPDLYIENSPLFHLPKVKTPMVIMANDADGAVPWYQGIELFTGLKRLGKKTWLLNYNGEAHNLRERKNQKDISIREQQFFDWLLKGEKPPRWITDGVPAVNKGKDWGLQLVD